MDITKQTKLSKAEWQSVEIPVPDNEKRILDLIISGFNNVNVKHNNNKSLLSIAKIEKSDNIESFFYTKFFKPVVTNIVKQVKNRLKPDNLILAFNVKDVDAKKLKSADAIRVENMTSQIESNRTNIMEFTLLEFTNQMLLGFYKGTAFSALPKGELTPSSRIEDSTSKTCPYAYYLYSLIQLRNISVQHLNIHVMSFIDVCISVINKETTLSSILKNAYDFIEKNPNIYKYGDIMLYDHQKKLYNVFNKPHDRKQQEQSNLVLYIAPTGTGKTLSPIGLISNYRVIFVCAARHVGMALAKSAISAQKCVAFAFGCESASDIRLHYYSAAVYTVNRKSGGIGKVDNSVGTKVEIMICDAMSYLVAMYYMLSFNDRSRIITYWDEPTIGMDYEEHPLHEIIHKNWSENKIPNMVLSSATLPSEEQLMPMIMDFRTKFDNVRLTTIESFEFNKSISVLNKSGYSVCPHNMFEEWSKLQQCVNYCREYKTLLRYFDLKEIVKFIEYLKEARLISEDYSAESYFENSIANIKMNTIKTYYLDLLSQISEAAWTNVYKYVFSTKQLKFNDDSAIKKTSSIGSYSKGGSYNPGGGLQRMNSVAAEPSYVDKAKSMSKASGGILLTTADAHTLTDGPTIYLTENIKTIGNFYIQQSSIPKAVFDDIFAKLTENNVLLEKISVLEASLEDELGDLASKEKKMSGEQLTSPNARKIDEQINDLRSYIKVLSLEPVYVPNTVQHQNIWSPVQVPNAFVPSIDPNTVKRIMELELDDRLKILLLLGIGSFETQENSAYTEIVKELAYEKRLFMIIASSDYIYGTNYQFCHEIIGKDLVQMSQQKTIQALGRVGRNNVQQDYTARFRDDTVIENLFRRPVNNIEANTMCKLLVTDDE
jgi:hypothetical protein